MGVAGLEVPVVDFGVEDAVGEVGERRMCGVVGEV